MDFERRIVTSHQVRTLSKNINKLQKYSKLFIGCFPFLVLSNCRVSGIFSTPHSEALGFVKVMDDHTIKISDRPGNSLLASISNVFNHRDIGPISSYLFLVTTKRFGSMAKLNFGKKNPINRFMFQRKLHLSGPFFKINEPYLRCARALMRFEI